MSKDITAGEEMKEGKSKDIASGEERKNVKAE